MKGINKAIILGTLMREPEIKNINNTFSYCELLVQTQDEWDDRQTGEKKVTEHFHIIKMMNKLQDICMQYLHRGSKVFIEAKINGRKYKAKDGSDGYIMDLQGISMQMLDSKPQKNDVFSQPEALSTNDLDSDELPF